MLDDTEGRCAMLSVTTLLEHRLHEWREIIHRPALSAPELTNNLEDLYRSIIETNFAALDVEEVTWVAPRAIPELFDLSLRLSEQMAVWRDRGVLTMQAVTELRHALRILRYTIDLIGEVANDFPRLEADEPTHRAFAGPAEWTLMHPARRGDRDIDFRSGDVILMRGQLHNSAAIARIGDVDSQFSHLGVVYVADNGKRWFVESLIEIGATLTPLEQALDHELGRAIVYRHRDPGLAERAAQLIYQRVRSSLAPFGGRIPYDFTMELDGGPALFCAKLVRQAYAEASARAFLLPTHGTDLAMVNRDFLDRLGVTAVDTFAPGDMEVEPQFDVVAEWRDYRVTASLRMQDLLMSKLFDWMDAHGYMFKADIKIGLLAIAGRLTSFLPIAIKKRLHRRLGLPIVPRNMTMRAIATIAMLSMTAEPIRQRLMALEDEQIRSTGRPLHPRQALAWLEQYRRQSGSHIGYLVCSADRTATATA